MERRRALYAALTVLAALALALLAAEGAVRILEATGRVGSGRAPRVPEAYGADAFRQGGLGPAGFLREGFAGEVSDEYGRPVPWVNNALGFRSRREFSPEPTAGTLRLLSLGDSFTAGYRVGQEETSSFLIEEWLRGRGAHRDAEVLIAAIEEPATGLDYLERHGAAFRPRAVLLGLTLGNDVAQVDFNLGAGGKYRLPPPGAGGVIEERPGFDPEAKLAAVRRQRIPRRCLAGAPAPPPTPPESPSRLLAFVRRRLADLASRDAPQAIVSTFPRAGGPRLFDSNGLGIFLEPPPPPIDRAYRRLFAVLTGYERLCRRRGIGLIVALFPQRYQVQPGDWRATVEAYRLDPACFDLEAPNRRILDFCRRRGLLCLDPTAAMAERHRESGASLYMPGGDMHWNREGHRAFFEAVREELAVALEGPGDGRDEPGRFNR